MRQRKAKDLDKRLQACSEYIVENPSPEAWNIAFAKTRELFLEIGCGKGQFIIKKAAENPNSNYIAIEGQETVILRACEKAMAVSGKAPWPENVRGQERLENLKRPLENLVFAGCFVNGMDRLFYENQLRGLYLNFSDPWPKAKHAKRRLTYRKRLMDYAWAVSDGGFIEIKTDNDGLFDFTLEEIESCSDGETRLELVEMTEDLHRADCRYDSRYTTTEYEDKFAGRGKKINYVKVTVRKTGE